MSNMMRTIKRNHIKQVVSMYRKQEQLTKLQYRSLLGRLLKNELEIIEKDGKFVIEKKEELI